jgi:hypothetical protein
MQRILASIAFTVALLPACSVPYAGTPRADEVAGPPMAAEGPLAYASGDSAAFSVTLPDPLWTALYDAAAETLLLSTNASGGAQVSLGLHAIGGPKLTVGTFDLAQLGAYECASELDCAPVAGSLEVRRYDLTCGTTYAGGGVCNDPIPICAGTIDMTLTLTPSAKRPYSGTLHLTEATSLVKGGECAG